MNDMIINVSDYVDYYIHYHYGRAQNLIPDAINTFNQKYSESINNLSSDMMQRQVDAIIKTMQAQGQDVSNSLEIAMALQNSNLLETTLDNIAEQLNRGIEKYQNEIGFDNYENIVRGAYNLSGMLENNGNLQNIQQFFNYLHDGLRLLGNEGQVDLETLVALTNIGQRLSNNPNFSLDWGDIMAISSSQVTVARRIADYLEKAAQKFESSGGTLSAASFRGTISNIFNTAIGEPLSRLFVAKGLEYVANIADQSVDNIMIGGSQGKLKWDSGSQPSLSGTRTTEVGGTSKVDIINDDVFSLSTQVNGQNITIEIGTNMSVKWHSSKKRRIQIVSNTTLGSLYNESRERTLAYNIIAHRKSTSAFNQAYRIVRAGTAASFFNNWLSGSGSQILGTSSIDRAQFLMINGRVYSVVRIVNNICEDIDRNQGNNSAFRMDIEGIDSSINRWWGTAGVSNIIEAQKRSNYVNGVLSKLTVGCTLNSNILTKYAY